MVGLRSRLLCAPHAFCVMWVRASQCHLRVCARIRSLSHTQESSVGEVAVSPSTTENGAVSFTSVGLHACCCYA